MKSIGKRIKKLRESLGIFQDVFAKSINISRVSVTDYENDKQMPGFEVLANIINVYKVDANWLLTGENSQSRNPEHEKLLAGFDQLHEDQKDEIIELINLKAARANRAKSELQQANRKIKEKTR